MADLSPLHTPKRCFHYTTVMARKKKTRQTWIECGLDVHTCGRVCNGAEPDECLSIRYVSVKTATKWYI